MRLTGWFPLFHVDLEQQDAEENRTLLGEMVRYVTSTMLAMGFYERWIPHEEADAKCPIYCTEGWEASPKLLVVIINQVCAHRKTGARVRVVGARQLSLPPPSLFLCPASPCPSPRSHPSFWSSRVTLKRGGAVAVCVPGGQPSGALEPLPLLLAWPQVGLHA